MRLNIFLTKHDDEYRNTLNNMKNIYIRNLKKLIFFVLISSVTTILCYTQDKQKPQGKFQIGLNMSPYGYHKVEMRFYTESQTDYTPVFSNKSYFSIGVSGYYRLNSFISIGTGISYNKYLITRQYHTYTPENQDIKILEVPLSLRFEFLKYIYASQGLSLNFELDKTVSRVIYQQTGIGYFMSLGFNYNFKSGLSVFAGPTARAYTIIPLVWGNDSDAENGIDVLYGINMGFGIMQRF